MTDLKACAELYNKVMTTYEEYCNRTDSFGDFEVEGKIYLGAEYPNHPLFKPKPPNKYGTL